MRRLVRLACFLAPALSLCVPEVAAACSYVDPPLPPPRNDGESETEHSARTQRWFRELAEQARQEALTHATDYEDRLWRSAGRVVLARVERTGSRRVRLEDGESWDSPYVTLRPLRWLKGSGPSRRLRLDFRPPVDSCGGGGVGDALGGGIGDVFLLFYGAGPLDTESILDTFARSRLVTQRSRSAFDVGAAPRTR